MTGCETGFGRYVRDRLKDQGHRVYGVGLHGPDYCLDFDYQDASAFRQAVAGLLDHLESVVDGVFDTLINNAGWTALDWMPDQPLETVERIMRINFLAAYEITRQFVDAAIAEEENPPPPQGLFKIVNTGSGAIQQGLRQNTAYVASKAALHGMTRTLGREFAQRYPIAVYTVSPAMVGDTAMIEHVIQRLMETRGMSREQAIAYNTSTPMGCWATHEDCWVAYDFAVNRATEYWSGSHLLMQGGSGL